MCPAAPLKPMHYLEDFYFSSVCKNLPFMLIFDKQQYLSAWGSNMLIFFCRLFTEREWDSVWHQLSIRWFFATDTWSPYFQMVYIVIYAYLAKTYLKSMLFAVRKYPGFKYLHGMVIDVIDVFYDTLWTAGISPQK